MKKINQEIFKIRGMEEISEKNIEDGKCIFISGLSEINRSHFSAAIAEKFKSSVLVICADDNEVERTKRYLECFTKKKIICLKDRDFVLFSSKAATKKREQQRIKALNEICESSSAIVIASIASLMQRTMPKEVMTKAKTKIQEGQTVSIEELEKEMISCGYEKADQVEGIGQYAKRGGIIDVFSPAMSSPARIDFWGDEIDTLSTFDVETQRREKNIKEYEILPVREAVARLSTNGKTGLQNILEEEAQKRKKSKNKRKIEILNEDAEKIRENIEISSYDRYLPFLYPYATAMDYISRKAIAVIHQPQKIFSEAKNYEKQIKEAAELAETIFSAKDYCCPWEKTKEKIEEFPTVVMDSFVGGQKYFRPDMTISVVSKQLSSYNGSLDIMEEDIQNYMDQNYRVVFLAGDSRKMNLLEEKFRRKNIKVSINKELETLPEEGCCIITHGKLPVGMEYSQIKLVVLSDSQTGGDEKPQPKRKRAFSGSNYEILSSYLDLEPGNYVVHEHHGIGRFSGVVQIPVAGIKKDYIKIDFAGTDCIYVPCTQLDLVAKYIGSGEDKPVHLSKLGGTDWIKKKQRAKAAAKDMAEELIRLYAERKQIKGHAFSPDSDWQRQFEENFEFAETDDQLKCINDIKQDMESSAPMDRLLCGDVGYGKTEVALRAAMKCLLDNMQVAFLCPTTVLAKQHYETAIQRFTGFPVEIEILSRFQTGKELNQTKEDILSGKADFVVGTHRLLQKDIAFKNLGLLIVDEEQRFGVSHKEHIKEISKGVDVLTLSATPIPRTLNMALSGIRDMSIIEEPPLDRLPVQTFVMEHNKEVIREAILKELNRGGQIYYVYNRIDGLEKKTRELRELAGDVTIGIAHGRMEKRELARAMEGVANGQTQILVCTTIIETGIDIPNVNTIIIEDADKMGLAQLHQLRGRVGRSARRAFAYLTYREDKVLSEVQEKRLSAVREFVEFGSGFKIAMRDLEIRGAGNILGAEQSGHLIDVGYDMYIKLLDEAVKEVQGQKVVSRCESTLDLAIPANIPETYVESQQQRMDLYRKIALIKTEEESEDILDEIIDRFGEPPTEVINLVKIALLRNKASQAGISEITQKENTIKFVIEDFIFEKISALYERSEYKNRLHVLGTAKPSIEIKLRRDEAALSLANKFITDWLQSDEISQ